MDKRVGLPIGAAFALFLGDMQIPEPVINRRLYSTSGRLI